MQRSEPQIIQRSGRENLLVELAQNVNILALQKLIPACTAGKKNLRNSCK